MSSGGKLFQHSILCTPDPSEILIAFPLFSALQFPPFICAHVLSHLSCPTLRDPDCSLTGSSVQGIFQAKYWSGLPFPTPGDLPHLGIEPMPLTSPVLSGMCFPYSSVGKESACNAGDPGLRRSPGEGIGYPSQHTWVSLLAQLVKNLLAKQETWVRSLGWEDSLEKRKATHSSTLVWRIPQII